MKLLRFGEAGCEKPGCLDAEGIIRDLSSIVSDLDGSALSRKGLAMLSALDLKSLPVVEQSARLGPCVSGVGNFVAVGLNYIDHAKETNSPIPTEPVLFNKHTSCIAGPNDPVTIPRGSLKTDWEVEIAFVIGEEVFEATEEKAMDYVAGFCVCHDISERAFQSERAGQWTKGKSAPTFGPLGPWLVTKDEIADVQNLDLWLDVNGQRMQTGSTGNMIFSIAFLVSYITTFMRLLPGDVVTTGTPAGVGLGRKPQVFLKAGDVVELGVEGLGSQRQVFRSAQ